MPQPETEAQKRARHDSDNYRPEFERDVAIAERLAQDAGYKPEKFINENGQKKILGVVPAIVNDLKSLGIISNSDASIIKKGKLAKNKDISHGTGEIMAVPEAEFEPLHNAVEKLQDISKNGFTIHLDNNS